MPFRLLQKWPRAYGFEIYGKGPCYVVSVEKGSLAYKSGLLPGDQLLEVGGQDVTNFSADEVKVLGKSLSTQPPELEVVSSLQTIIITPDTKWGYGFNILSEKPIVVRSVDFNGPAYTSGLRSGDIILEANCNSKAATQNLKSILFNRSGQLTLLMIPVSRTSNMVQVDKSISRIAGFEAKLYKAKDIHNKLESVLGQDYKKKMAVVTALKQYAEDRDIILLCEALKNVLKLNDSRNIFNTIRLLIPPVHRMTFDELTNSHLKEKSLKIGQMPNFSSDIVNQEKRLKKKKIQLVKQHDSFGFVVKSSHPAYVESVDKGGAAEQAGLKVGDLIIKLNGIDVSKCEHDKLIQLLQESGSAPTIEVCRSSNHQQGHQIQSYLSSISSSSHESEEILLFDDSVTDNAGYTFNEKANYLLTLQERNMIKKAFKNYSATRNIIQFYDALSVILDTPSKKLLWQFIMLQLPQLHQEFILHRVDFLKPLTVNSVKFSEANPTALKIQGLPTSLQQQIDYLLSSKEQSQFRKCLHEYEVNHDLSSLLYTLDPMLDTPSKKILWQAAIPQLTKNHAKIVHSRIGFQNQKTGEPDNQKDNVLQTDSTIRTEHELLYEISKIPDSEQNIWEEDGESLKSWSSQNSKKINQSDLAVEYDMKLMQELGETKKVVQEIRDALVKQKKDTSLQSDVQDIKNSSGKNYVTIIPVGLTEQELKILSERKTFHSLGTLNTSPLTKENLDLLQITNDTTIGILSDSHINYSSDSSSDDEEENISKKDNNFLPNIENELQDHESSEQDNTRNSMHNMNIELKPVKKMDFGLKSVKLGNQGWKNKDTKEVELKLKTANEFIETVDKEINTSPSTPHPVPIPPPPLLPEANLDFNESLNKMSVKRINWEKLDNRTVINTVWEKLNDHDLAEVINYLELETQFSTKPVQMKEKAKRKEILIMDEKKAYNISILLGHLKMPAADVKKALYTADEQILSPGLLEQLLAFVPSQNEITKYKLYKGDKSALTQPDQFIYQMSLVGNYEERLQGLLFKANFKEKCNEIKQNLENIKNAATELRNSEKLTRLLEIILAMGNYMNKGNSRIGEAAGFRITFLQQLDTTKTTDNKSSFLHVLADAAYTKFPEVLTLSDELSSVQKAAKISHDALIQDINYLRKSLQDTTTFLSNIYQQTSEPDDCFKDVLSHFLIEASKEIDLIDKLHENTMAEFSNAVAFFGEDPTMMTFDNLFDIFSKFISSFEKAHSHNLMFKKK